MRLEPSLRFDHFAYPVDDLVKAEDFYTGVLEIPIYERRGLRVRDVQAGTLPRTFLNVAGSRVGIFLGRESLPEYEQRHGCPLVGLEITGDGMTRVVRRLEETHYKNYDEPRPRVRSWPRNDFTSCSKILSAIILSCCRRIGSHRMALPLMWGSATWSWKLPTSIESVDFYMNVFGLKAARPARTTRWEEPPRTCNWSAANGSCSTRLMRCTPRSSAFYRFEGQHYAFMTPTPKNAFSLARVDRASWRKNRRSGANPSAQRDGAWPVLHRLGRQPAAIASRRF